MLGRPHRVKDRIARHKYSIRDKLDKLPLARHFIEKGHTESQLRFMVIDDVSKNRRGGNRELELRKREVNWIHQLDTLQPKRLNSDFKLYLFFKSVYILFYFHRFRII